jgi:hypothetical protein
VDFSINVEPVGSGTIKLVNLVVYVVRFCTYF